MVLDTIHWHHLLSSDGGGAGFEAGGFFVLASDAPYGGEIVEHDGVVRVLGAENADMQPERLHGVGQRVRVAAVGVDVAEYEGDLLPEVFCATEAGPYACATASDDGWVVDASTPVVLVRRQAWAPGWSVDGRPVEQVLGTLQAVPLGAGRHTVRFEYEPPGLALGASLSLLSLLVLVWLRARRRREDE